MGIRGRKRRLEIEAEYWRLLQSGVGTVEACKLVGVGRKTGYRWRAENGGLPPERVAEPVHSGRYLSLLERKRIATLREHGLGVRKIAARLDRSPSTVSRELRRNTLDHDRGIYAADLAHHRSRKRGSRPHRPKLQNDAALRAEVQAKLHLEWSPEQIAAHLRVLWPDQPERHLCHETIYRALYQGAKGVLSRTLTKKLRTGRSLRRRRRSSSARAPRFQTPAVLIHDRPAVVDQRDRVGDWEGDLVVGRGNRSAVATLVDRRSRLLRLIPLPGGHDSARVRDAITAAMQTLPEAARLTLTWDQGIEMARHHELAPLFSDGIYFAYPASPWQRGTNENTNGLLRQYLPEGTDLSVHTLDELRLIEDRPNNRPRKTLGWRTPADVFTAALTA
ncbi:IS30 family transposase [Kitasatospora phosalacinea]|uniref:IS30 family transposase n=1 Tax=Kitasatospora phosalacinea TaxID=2065 RepID=A0A9W6QI79_9ACTN|nr:IS30 family transposase [Kitasatospora phosalacinea]GLW75489.1 IS30 family transposase [Kitasatospora phosalacinea]